MSRILSGQKKGGSIIIEAKIVPKEFYLFRIGVEGFTISRSATLTATAVVIIYRDIFWRSIALFKLLIRSAELLLRFPAAGAIGAHIYINWDKKYGGYSPENLCDQHISCLEARRLRLFR